MTRSKVLGAPLITVGVVLIVLGLGLALVGVNEERLAEEWAHQKESECANAVVSTLPANASPEEISRTVYEQCSGPYRSNPYRFGGTKIATGVVTALLGGAVAYYGAR